MISFPVCNAFLDKVFVLLTILSKKPPCQGANCMINIQSTPTPFTNSTVSFDTNFLPLSEIMTDGQPRLLTNRLKPFMDEVESICGTTSSITPRVPAHVYKVTHTLKSVELSLAKILLTNNGLKLFIPVA